MWDLKHYFFYMGRHSLLGQVLLLLEVSRSHSDMLYPWGVLVSIDGNCTWGHKTHIRGRYISIPTVRFEPAVPTRERLQTHAVGRTATGKKMCSRNIRSFCQRTPSILTKTILSVSHQNITIYKESIYLVILPFGSHPQREVLFLILTQITLILGRT